MNRNQSEAPSNPDEALVPYLRNMPTIAGTGMVTHPGVLRGWSKHLVEAGVVHVDALWKLADENGNIHVSQLPKQLNEFQAPFRGPNHPYNNAARWVPKGTPMPEPKRLPDIKELTDQENQVMLKQYRDAGMIPDPVLQYMKAQELN